jgi:hypothetical protein
VIGLRQGLVGSASVLGLDPEKPRSHDRTNPTMRHESDLIEIRVYRRRGFLNAKLDS